MTVTTRRRVVLAFLTLALALPVEIVLLQALSTTDSKTAVRSWVTNLDSETLAAVSEDISSYPLLYRREIMRALNADKRSQVWRRHIQRYIDAHPGLDSSARVVLEAAVAFAAPAVFDRPSDADRQQMQILAEQTVTLLGREEAEYVFYRLGPRDGKFASAEPLSMRWSNWVRGLVVAMADSAADCNCNVDFGCDGTAECRNGATCTVDDDWPACGWFWFQTCNGLCTIPVPQG